MTHSFPTRRSSDLSFANLNNLCQYRPKHASTLRMRAGMNAVVTQIGDLAAAGEKMVERLRRKAFLPDSRKELTIRSGIAEAAQLLGCSTTRIRMAEEEGCLPPAPTPENGRRPGSKVEEPERKT